VLAARLYALFVLRAASLAGESAVPG
jgi:hypothetical protein